MLLDSKCTLINQLRFDLLFDDDVRKRILVKTGDIVDCYYSKDKRKAHIVGKVVKIGCSFNATLGRADTSVYMNIDGSGEFCGCVEHIKPNHVLDLTVVQTNEQSLFNPVCSVDNSCQKIILVRENEIGQFQYSKDGIKWKTAGQGPHGMSAYECACILGFKGTEAEWIASLHGARGPAMFHGKAINGDPCCDCDGCTCSNVYPASEVENAIIGDMYFNYDKKAMYVCTIPGDPETAAWQFLTSLIVEQKPTEPDPEDPDNPPPQPPSDYELPIASKDTLGGVKIGDGVNVVEDGTISVDKETISKEAADILESNTEEFTEDEIKGLFRSDKDEVVA